MLAALPHNHRIMNFDNLTRAWLNRIESKLDSVLPPGDRQPARLHEAMRYSVLGGGKRIRPVLVYATGEALGVDLARLDGPAAAIELMHAFSLVHDDLPAMDDDDLRRGRPTTHIAYDEATAILAADALQPLAFQVLATDPSMACDAQTRLKLIEQLAEACGSDGMTGGQSIDLSAEGRQLEADELELMYQLKTGRLLKVSVLSAAYCADLQHPLLPALERFVDAVGLAFQIKDDLLDIEGETAVIGKQQGADIQRGKATWPALFGMDAARATTQKLLDQALAELEVLGPEADGLRNVARYIVNRES
jgi:farnesyl diphosphate synthase